MLVGQDHILPSLFGRVLTVPAVMRELSHSGAPASVRTWAASPPKWLEVLAPSVVEHSPALGLGEAEAIALACELHANTLLLDERRASLVARQLGLNVTGTLGVLELAAERRLIDLPGIIAVLRGTTFRCPDELFDELLRRDAQRRLKAEGKSHKD